MRSKVSLLAALAIVLAVTEMAVAFGLSKSSAPAAATKTIASCCPDGPCCPDCPCCPVCCGQMADGATAAMADCDCPFCSGLATAKASCCPDGDCCPNGACCKGTAVAKDTKK